MPLMPDFQNCVVALDYDAKMLLVSNRKETRSILQNFTVFYKNSAKTAFVQREKLLNRLSEIRPNTESPVTK